MFYALAIYANLIFKQKILKYQYEQELLRLFENAQKNLLKSLSLENNLIIILKI
jgi:hypothetical protein